MDTISKTQNCFVHFQALQQLEIISEKHIYLFHNILKLELKSAPVFSAPQAPCSQDNRELE